MNDARKRRYPPALANELIEALFLVRDLPREVLFRYLADLRRSNPIQHGLTLKFCPKNKKFAPDEKKIALIRKKADPARSIPLMWLHPVIRLDAAFRKLHAYRREGGGDMYMSLDVYREAQKLNRRHGKARDKEHNSRMIAAHLQRSGYEKSSDKHRLIQRATEHFGCSESTVRRAWRDRNKNVG